MGDRKKHRGAGVVEATLHTSLLEAMLEVAIFLFMIHLRAISVGMVNIRHCCVSF